MYTIREAATRTGISIPTIRVWERRYGVVSPTRTPAGYRLYDEQSIARLHAMRQLIEHGGWRPSQAAQRVLAAGSDIAQVLSLSGPTGPGDQSERGGLAPGRAGEVVDALLRASRRLDVRGIERLLDESFAAQRFESAMDQVVFPALRAIGTDWELGHIDAAREHAASETIRRRIAHYFDAAGGGDGDATVMVGLPPGSHHELGAFAFAVAARRAGLNVLYLGANVPIEGWIQTVLESTAAVVVLAVVTRRDVAPAASVIAAIRSAGATAAIAVGGPSAGNLPPDDTILRLTGSIDATVDVVAGLVERGGKVAG